MSEIFLSYARGDESRARLVAEALKRDGLDVWWDRHIPPSETWADVIESAIDESSVVVVLWTEESVASQWVRKEARRGEGGGKLVPARLDDIEPPFEFDHIQAADLVGWEGDPASEGFRQLVDAARRLMENPPPRPKPLPKLMRAAVTALLAALAATPLALLGWFLLEPATSARVSLGGLELDGFRFTAADSVSIEPLSVDWLIVSSGDGVIDNVLLRPQEGEPEVRSELDYLSLKPVDESGSIRLVGLVVPADSMFEVQRTGTELRLYLPSTRTRAIAAAGRVSVSTPTGSTIIDFGEAGSILLEESSRLFLDIPESGYEGAQLFRRADIRDLGLYVVEAASATADPTIRSGTLSAPWLGSDVSLAGQRLGFDSFQGAMSSVALYDDRIETSVEGYQVTGIRLGGSPLMPSRFQALGASGKALLVVLALAYCLVTARFGRRVWRARYFPLARRASRQAGGPGRR